MNWINWQVRRTGAWSLAALRLTGMLIVIDISAPDEILLLLFQAPNNRLTRVEIREFAPHHRPNSLQTAISRLIADRDLRPADGGEVALTPKGQKRVIEKVLAKLSRDAD